MKSDNEPSESGSDVDIFGDEIVKVEEFNMQ